MLNVVRDARKPHQKQLILHPLKQKVVMKKETLYKLQYHYGELMQELKTCNDYFKKKRIEKKMKAIECLLDIDYVT